MIYTDQQKPKQLDRLPRKICIKVSYPCIVAVNMLSSTLNTDSCMYTFRFCSYLYMVNKIFTITVNGQVLHTHARARTHMILFIHTSEQLLYFLLLLSSCNCLNKYTYINLLSFFLLIFHILFFPR